MLASFWFYSSLGLGYKLGSRGFRWEISHLIGIVIKIEPSNQALKKIN
jgi:hypothetical protein